MEIGQGIMSSNCCDLNDHLSPALVHQCWLALESANVIMWDVMQ